MDFYHLVLKTTWQDWYENVWTHEPWIKHIWHNIPNVLEYFTINKINLTWLQDNVCTEPDEN